MRDAPDLRPLGDSSWIQRMAALQQFVEAGPAATQPLPEELASDDGSIRALRLAPSPFPIGHLPTKSWRS